MTARSLSKAKRSLARCDRGAAAVEFGLIAPALFLLLFGEIELGRMVWTQSSLHYAVQEAARCASVASASCDTPDAVAAYAAARIAKLGVAASAFTVTTQACGHQVTASVPYAFVASRLFPVRPVLTAKACLP